MPLYGGGKRLHIAAAELGEDVSGAASRLGSALRGTFTFGGRSKAPAPATAPDGGGEDGNAPNEGPVKDTSARGKSVLQDDGIPADGYARGEAMDIDQGQQQGRSKSPVMGEGEVPVHPSFLNIAGGDPKTGGKSSSQGRIDFSLQEGTLESQYVAALSAHFCYWNSLDVGAFVHRALHGMDVLSAAAPIAGGGGI